MKKIPLFLLAFSLIGFLILFNISDLVYGQNKDLESFSKGETSRFYTKGYPKAKGLDISIEYPRSWTSSELEDPMVVQFVYNFFGKPTDDGIGKGFRIFIGEFPKDLVVPSTEDDWNNIYSIDNLKSSLPKGDVFIKGGQTKYDGQPGAWTIYSTVIDQGKLKMYVLNHNFYWSGKGISITCYAVGPKRYDKRISSVFNENLPLFIKIGDSVIIQDKAHASWWVRGLIYLFEFLVICLFVWGFNRIINRRR